MTDWNAVLRTIAPKGKRTIISGLAEAMPRVVELAELTTSLRVAHFLAQVAHESDGFSTTVEYASGEAYEGRRDLGNTQEGDGKRFKGRGLIQLTGRANYCEFGAELDIDLVGNPGLAAKFPYAAQTAALYWRKRAINAGADADDLVRVTRKINGGKNGLMQRAAYLKGAKRALSALEPKADDAPEPITVQDLRKAGSRTIAGVDQAKSGLGGLATAAAGATAIGSQISDVAGQVQSAADSVSSATSALTWAEGHWKLLVLILALLAAGYFAWRIWRGASLVEQAKVEDAKALLRIGG